MTLHKININNDSTKSYATEANLEKGTAAIDKMIVESDASFSGGHVRKVNVKNADNRWTSLYFVSGDATIHVISIARAGFMCIG